MPETPASLRGASVLVAGATGGIGSAIVCDLHRRGAILTMVARDQGRLDALPVPGRRLAADLRSPEACESSVEAASEHGNGLDIVVNTVGVVAFGAVADLAPDTMEELFLTNVFVPMMLAGAAVGRLRRGGAIVNVSGAIAERNLPGLAAYGASKAAVRSFDEALAREMRRVGIRVIDARPPHTATGFADRAIAGTAPRLGRGVDPSRVATRICDALESGDTDLPSTGF